VLNLLAPLPPTGLQIGQQLFTGVTLPLRHRSAALLTFQQSGQPTRLERVHPVEKTPPTNA
jgi:hypothetical protein